MLAAVGIIFNLIKGLFFSVFEIASKVTIYGWMMIGIVVGAAYVFYEGVPIAKKIPYIHWVPYAGYAIEGRVSRYHRLESLRQSARIRHERDRIAEKLLVVEAETDRAEAERDLALDDAIAAKKRADEAENAKPETIVETKVETQIVKVPTPYTITDPTKADVPQPGKANVCPKPKVIIKRPSRRSCLDYMPGARILQSIR